MPRRLLAAWVLASLLATSPAAALDHAELGASVGFELPTGSLERGSQVSDTTWGAVPVRLDAEAFFTRRVAAYTSFGYALAIPKLCATASDCEASLGHDIALEIGARLALVDLGRASLRLDSGIGWEWYSTTLSDQGVASTRSFSGPTVATLGVAAPVRLSHRLTLGPGFALRVGVFTQESRTTPSWTQSSIDGRAVHAWLRPMLQVNFAL